MGTPWRVTNLLGRDEVGLLTGTAVDVWKTGTGVDVSDRCCGGFANIDVLILELSAKRGVEIWVGNSTVTLDTVFFINDTVKF